MRQMAMVDPGTAHMHHMQDMFAKLFMALYPSTLLGINSPHLPAVANS